jgi:hypothetical protein
MSLLLIIKSVTGAVLEISDKLCFVQIALLELNEKTIQICSDETVDLGVVMFCALACSWQDCI